MSLVIIVTLLSACNDINGVSNGYRSVSSIILNSQTVTSNSNYELNWDSDGKAILLKSLVTQDYWSDILYDAFLEGSTSVNGNSPISITVVNTKSLKWDTVSSYSEAAEKGSVVCKAIENGIRVTYFFDTYKIAVPIDYVLRDDCLSVSIDSSKILEDGTDYKLVSVSLIPYFCSVKNDAENGSLFIPSGSGAIMYSRETSVGTKEFSGEVYGEDGSRRNPRDLTNSESIRLPVFGAYGDNKGIMAIIEKGVGAAEINAKAGNSRLGYSNVGVTFNIRGYDEFIFTYHGKYQGLTKRVYDYNPGQIFSVSYYPIFGEEASYSGIAKKYREYLIDNGDLKQEKQEKNYGIYSVNIVGGTTVTKSALGIPYKKLVALTSFSEAGSIIEDIVRTNSLVPTVRMSGYGDKGVRMGSIAGTDKFSPAYGDKTDISDLITIRDDIDIFFDFDVINFSNSKNGFSLKSDVAKTAIMYDAEHFLVNPLRVIDKQNPYYTISRNRLFDSVEFAIKKAKKYGIKNVSFSSLGCTAFSDYAKLDYANKNKIDADVGNILSGVMDQGYGVAVSDANYYAACNADIIFDTPVSNGSYDAFDLEVPFYQMVFHSYKHMYTPAINLESNSELAVCKAVSYGMGLGYTLSYRFEDSSDDLDEFNLYGIVYDDVKDEMSRVLCESDYKEIYKATIDAELVAYNILDNGVCVSTFNNNITVYSNYTDKNVICPIGELEPYQFVMSKEGEI